MPMSCLCDVVDPEDLEPILLEFMPGVFQQFEQTMEAIKTLTEFTFDQQYIKSVVELISAAAQSIPALFNDYIDGIMENFVIIIQRTINLDESGIFCQTFNSMTQLADKYAQQMAKYVDVIYPLMAKVLKL